VHIVFFLLVPRNCNLLGFFAFLGADLNLSAFLNPQVEIVRFGYYISSTEGARHLSRHVPGSCHWLDFPLAGCGPKLVRFSI